MLIRTLRKKLARIYYKFFLMYIDNLSVVKIIRSRKLTYLSDKKFIQVIRSVKNIEKGGVGGGFIEAGCALGGSLSAISSYARERSITVYDTFEMIPPPGEKDPKEVHDRYAEIVSGQSRGIDGDVYYGYRGDLRSFVKEQVADIAGEHAAARVVFHKGLLQDTMKIDAPVAFAHIDVDWYDPVMFCIVEIWPHLSRGGVLIFDDYFDWGGCRKAVDEFFEGRSDCAFDGGYGNMKVVKTA